MLRSDLIERINNAFTNSGIFKLSDVEKYNLAYNIELINKTNWRLNPTLRFDLIWESHRSLKGYRKLGVCWIYPGDYNIEIRLQKAFNYSDFPFIRPPPPSDMQGYWRFIVYNSRDVNYIGDIVEWYIIPKILRLKNLIASSEIKSNELQITDFIQYIKHVGYDEYLSYDIQVK